MVRKAGSPSLMLSRPLNLSPHPACQHHPDHFVVADERPQRILKRGRLILLDEEMANPRGAVTRDQGQREEPPSANDDEENGAAERDRGANEVEQTRARLTVFGDIVGPELGE